LRDLASVEAKCFPEDYFGQTPQGNAIAYIEALRVARSAGVKNIARGTKT